MLSKKIVTVYSHLLKGELSSYLNHSIINKTLLFLRGIRFDSQLNVFSELFGTNKNLTQKIVKNTLENYLANLPYLFIEVDDRLFEKNQAPEYVQLALEIYDLLVLDVEMSSKKALNFLLYLPEEDEYNLIPGFGPETQKKLSGKLIPESVSDLKLEYNYQQLTFEGVSEFFKLYFDFLSSLSLKSKSFLTLNEIYNIVNNHPYTPYKFKINSKLIRDYLHKNKIISYTNQNNFFLTDKGVRLGFEVKDYYSNTLSQEVSYIVDSYESISFVLTNIKHIFYLYYGFNPITLLYLNLRGE